MLQRSTERYSRREPAFNLRVELLVLWHIASNSLSALLFHTGCHEMIGSSAGLSSSCTETRQTKIALDGAVTNCSRKPAQMQVPNLLCWTRVFGQKITPKLGNRS